MGVMDRYNEKKKKKEEEKSSENSSFNLGVQERFDLLKDADTTDYEVNQVFIDSFISDANSFLGSAEEDYGNMKWGNASSSYDTRRKSYADLYSRSSAINRWLDDNKSNIDEETYSSFLDTINSINRDTYNVYNSFKQKKDYASSFSNEDDYNKAVAEAKAYKEEQVALAGYHLPSLKKSIDDLESFYSEVNGYYERTKDQKSGNKAVTLNHLLGKRGFNSIEELRSHIDGLQETYNKAYVIQNTNRVNPESDYYDPDTAQWVEKGKAIKNPSVEDASTKISIFGYDFGGEEVQNPVSYARDNYEEHSLGNPTLTALNQGALDAKKINDLYVHMTDEEANAYYALLAQDKEDGGSRSETYLSAINETLEKRKAGEISTPMTDAPALGLLFDAGYKFGSFFEDAVKMVTNTEGEKSDPSVMDYMANIIATENEDAWGSPPKWMGLGDSWYNVASDTTGTIAYMLPSILAAKLTGGLSLAAGASTATAGTISAVVGSGSMGMASAGSGYQEMIDLGYSKEQARTYGIMVGAAEGLTSYALSGISAVGGKLSGNFIKKAADKIDNAIGRFAVNLGGHIGSEILEEEIQLWLEPAIKTMVLDVDFDAPNADEMLYTALVTAFSTFLLEGGGTAKAEIDTVNKGKELKADGEVDRLVELGKTYSADTVAHQLANKVNKDTGAYTIGRLFNEVNASLSEANIADITKALVERGFTQEQADSHAKWLNHVVEGGTLTKRQQVALENNDVLAEVLYGTIIQSNSTVMQRNQAVAELSGREISMGVDRKALEESQTPEAITKRMTAKRAIGEELVRGANQKSRLSAEQISEIDTIAAAIASIEETKNRTVEAIDESSYEVSENGQMVNTATGETIDPQGLVQAKDGTYMIAAKDAEPVSRTDVSYSDAEQAMVYETFLTLEDHSGKISKVLSDMDLESRNALLGIYNPNVNKSGSEFVNGVFDAFFYGHRGIDMNTSGKNSPMMSLTAEQRQIAWNTGRTAGMQSTTKAQGNVDTAYAEAKKALEQSGVKKGNYNATLEDGISPMQLNEKQKAVYAIADDIAQGVQTNIRIYAGKNKAQGFYDHITGEIWLNLNAANTSREAIMAFTLAHELVHRGKDGSPAKYQAFVDFLMKEYGKQGADLEAMIAQELAAAEEFDKHAPADKKINMTREQALEEVVCDACQRMLLDTNAGQKLAEFGAQSKQNKSFLADLKRWISELLDKLRNYFKGIDPDSLAAKEFAKFDANVKQILADMYVDMSIDAGEKLSTIHAAGDAFVEKLLATKDIQYNLELVKTHKDKLQKEFSEDSATDLDTIMKRYDKIIDIWTRLGGELNSKFLEEWNSKVGKDRTFTIFKAQAGYKYNVELSSMCKKGVPLFEAIDTIVKQEVMKELGTNVLGKAEKEILYDILKRHHFEIPCAICYVEQARQREGVIIDAFLNGKVDKNSKGKITKVKLGWNQVLDSIEKEMKANGVDYTFAQVSRDIATEKYSPANLDMDMKTQVAFYAALKKIANKEIARYNKAEKKSRTLLSNTTPEAVKKCFAGTLPSNLKIFKVLFEEPSSRFKIQSDLLYSSVATQNLSMAHNKLYGLFNSQGGVSGYKTKQGTTIYWGDILGKTWKPDTLRKEGGVRNQSNSDSQMYTLLDQAQMYIDFTAKGYYLQAYTKVLSMLKLFGLSRGKINASLIPKVVEYKNADGSVDIERTMATAGLDENGNPIYDDIEGINHNEAFMLIEDSEYSKNICGICIGYSDAHILKLLDDPRVQQIIGFHDKTDDGSKRYKGARYAKNYNGLNEAVDKEGKTKHIGFNPYVKNAEKKFRYNEETETFEGTVNYKGKTYTADDIPRLAADLYLEMCEKKGYTPAYKDFANHPNYYKLLADFGLKDSQGHYAPHRKVVYNMPDTVPYLDANGKKQTMKTYDYIKVELEKELAVRDSIADALADTSSEGIIPQFKTAVKKSQEKKSHSLPKVFADAVEKFGTTTDFAEAGYLLPSGKMLKFTDDKHSGERQYDHRAIGMVYGVDVDLGVNHGFNEESGKFLDEFVENGGIRFDAGDPDLDMDVGLQLSSTVPITKEQEQLIRDLVEWKQNREELFEANLTEDNFLYEGPLAIRIDFGGDSKYAVGGVSAKDLSAWGKKSLEYDGGNINADRIIADIRHYYKTGETRKPSVVSQFHYSLPKITEDMTDAERYEILKDATISVQSDDGSATHIDKIKSLAELGDKAKSKAEKIIIPLAKDLGILNKPMTAADIDIEFTFSRWNGLQESLSKQLRYGGNYVDFAKTIINLDKVINSAVLIEKHADKYQGTSRANENLQAVYVLFSAFRDGDFVIPVQLEIKKSSDVGGRLYLTVAMTKIEASVLGRTPSKNQTFSLIPASITYSLADIFRKINPQDGHFLKYLPDDFLSEAQKDAKRKAIAEDDARIASYKLPIGEDTSPRALLANAFEGIITNDIEKRNLQKYKSKVDMLNAEEQKLHELRAQIKELSFAKGKRDTKKINELRFDANQTASRIATLDKTLLGMEASAPLRDILKREKEMAKKRQKQKDMQLLADYKEKSMSTVKELMKRNQESRQKAIEGRDKTVMRHKIKGIVKELDTLLRKPTAKKHIKEELRAEVADALLAINMDTVGADERVARYNEMIAKAKDPDIIEELVKSRDNIQLQGDNLKEKLTALQNAYEKIKASEDIELSMSYQEVIRNSIKNVTDNVGNTSIRNMSLEQLEMVYDLFSMIRKTIRNANKAFNEQKGQTIMQMAEAVNDQVRTVGGQTYKRNAIVAALQRAGWTLLKPYTAFRTIGSVTLTNLYKELRAGEDTFYGDVKDAQEFIEDQYEKLGYKSWDMKQTKSFTAKSGKSFDLTLEQMMTLYAYSRREQAHKHIIDGGIVFEDAMVVEKNKLGVPIKYEVTTKDAFNLSEETFSEICNSLSAEQKAFVDAMQEYLSKTMGAKGNEVSMELLGVKLFKEEFYLPIKSSQEYMNFSAEEAGEVKLRNPAFSKETVKHANNPIVLHNFTDLWAEHINDMSMYHAFVLALEDFTRVYNYKSKTDTKLETISTKATLDTAFPGATKYINEFLKDMNGGVRSETVGWAEKLTSLAKKGAVLGSLSVAIQQPSAVMRAMAFVNPKHFIATTPKSLNLVKHKQDWAELKKYAPIAGIKEMGKFDVGMGQGTVDWIKSNKTLMNKAEDFLSAGPAFMDEITWVSIWNAVKRETTSNNKNLRPDSEELLKLAGERFTDVISLSQVYDSVFSRSDIMRNKSWIAKATTAFMAEPMTTLNMMIDAFVQGKRSGNFKGFVKTAAPTAGAIVAAYVLNAALKSIVTAARDDDEDETYAEKYLEHFVGDFKDSLNPLTLVPFAKDVVSIFQGYDVERMDMSLVSDLYKAIEAFDSDNKTMYEKWSGLIGATSAFFGIPVKNVEREVRAVINVFFGERESATKQGLLDAISEGWTGESKSNGQQLYEAMLSGDAAHIERIEGRFKDQKAIDSAIRTALRENDPRIKEAAQARIGVDIDKYKSLVTSITSEGNFSQDLVVKAINAEINKINQEADDADGSTDDEDDSKETSIFKASDINAALENGDTSAALEVIGDLVEVKTNDYIAEGEKKKDAEKKAKSSVKSSLTSYWKPLYLAAYKSKNTAEMTRIRKLLKATKLYDDVVETCQDWVKQSK